MFYLKYRPYIMEGVVNVERHGQDCLHLKWHVVCSGLATSGLEHAVHIHQIFEPCPLNANVARWWNGHSTSHLPVLEHWRGSLWIYVIERSLTYPKGLSERGVSLIKKTILLKTRKPFSCRALSDDIVPIHGANVSGRLRFFRPSIEIKEKNMTEVFQLLHLSLHFLASTVPLTSSNDKTSICKLNHNNWTSNKKWQSISKLIATGISAAWKRKSLWNYIQT